ARADSGGVPLQPRGQAPGPVVAAERHPGPVLRAGYPRPTPGAESGRGTAEGGGLSIHSYYQGGQGGRSLLRRLRADPPFHLLFAQLTILGPGPFFWSHLETHEIEDVLDGRWEGRSSPRRPRRIGCWPISRTRSSRRSPLTPGSWSDMPTSRRVRVHG